MKRSTQIRLILLGGVSAGALTACAPGSGGPPITPENVYPNDHFVAGAGYYHAPFHAFYPKPYNVFDPARRQYFFGGQWGNEPYRSIVNVSAPTLAAAQAAEAARRAAVQRSGFGRTGHSHYLHS